MSKFTAKDYGKLLDWAIANNVEESKLVSFFVNEVVKNNDISKLKNAFKIFENLSNKRNGISKIKVISAYELDESLKKEIVEFIAKNFNVDKNKSNIKYLVDEKILGGIKIFVNDELIDLSISRKLGELRKKLIR